MSWFSDGAEGRQTLRFFLVMLPVMAVVQLVGEGGLPRGTWTGLLVGTLVGAVIATALYYAIGKVWYSRRRRRP